jgi:FkbM family methyltransferase
MGIETKLYGSEYGGFIVAPSLITNGTKALCAGVGEDISFDIQLMGLHDMIVVGVDPTLKSLNYIAKTVNRDRYHLLEKALTANASKDVTIYENSNPEYVSESILSSHESVDTTRSRLVSTITYEQLVQQHGLFSVVKLDIEGAEYEVIENLYECNATHFCVEFHHHCTGFSIDDTKNAMSKLTSLGFNALAQRNDKEMTFFKVSI